MTLSIMEALAEAETMLARNGIAESRREAMSLLEFAIGKDKTFLYAHPETMLSPAEVEHYVSIVRRRSEREPLQYITGVQEFYGRIFEVTPDVLVPRPETEMVVEQGSRLIREGGHFCEVGIGSGCIAISILAETNGTSAIGLDVSASALAVAYRNAQRHDVADRLELEQSDVFSALDPGSRFDMIVSNPPYVPIRDLPGLQPEVRDFEPEVALTDGADGLSIIREIIAGSPRFLRRGGFLLMEIGFDQSERIAAMFDGAFWERPELLPDLQGIPRLVKARLANGT